MCFCLENISFSEEKLFNNHNFDEVNKKKIQLCE